MLRVWADKGRLNRRVEGLDTSRDKIVVQAVDLLDNGLDVADVPVLGPVSLGAASKLLFGQRDVQDVDGLLHVGELVVEAQPVGVGAHKDVLALEVLGDRVEELAAQ